MTVGPPETANAVKRILARVPSFQGRTNEIAAVEPLAGLSNQNFKVTLNGVKCVVRVPGAGTKEYIDRRAEKHNACVAAEEGFSPEVFFYDEDDGSMVSKFVENSIPLHPDSFRDGKYFQEITGIWKKLHGCKREFLFRFDVFAMIRRYHSVLLGASGEFPPHYEEMRKRLAAIQRALEDHPVPLAPCHNDGVPENFLYDGRRAYLIDWEYSGMNDPMWELGDFVIEASLNEQQERLLMECYYAGGEVPENQYGRMVMYKALCDFLWALWGLIQVANNRSHEEFFPYAMGRWNRCRETMGTKNFSRHLAAVSKEISSPVKSL